MAPCPVKQGHSRGDWTLFKLTTKSIFVAALVTVIPTNFAAALDQPSPSKGYFISIDGMRPDYLETLVKEG